MRYLFLMLALILSFNAFSQDYYVTDQISYKDRYGRVTKPYRAYCMVQDEFLVLYTVREEKYGDLEEYFHYYTTISGATVYTNSYSDMSIEKTGRDEITVTEHVTAGAKRIFVFKKVKKKDADYIIKIFENGNKKK